MRQAGARAGGEGEEREWLQKRAGDFGDSDSMRLTTFSFDSNFARLFFHWGLVVHRFRAVLLGAPLLLTGLLSVGFYWIGPQVSPKWPSRTQL